MGCKMTKKTARRGKTAQKTQKQAVDPDELFDISEIENMKRVQLQKLCRQCGIKVSGKVSVACNQARLLLE